MQCKLLLLCRLATADLDREEGVMPPKVTLRYKRAMTFAAAVCNS